MSVVKKIKSAIEGDIHKDEINLINDKSSSDLLRAMEILHNPTNMESNTILTNAQVNALTMMNRAGQIYGIEFFNHFCQLFPRYRISGDDGRGRKELIEVAKAIRQEKIDETNRYIELLGRR